MKNPRNPLFIFSTEKIIWCWCRSQSLQVRRTPFVYPEILASEGMSHEPRDAVLIGCTSGDCHAEEISLGCAKHPWRKVPYPSFTFPPIALFFFGDSKYLGVSGKTKNHGHMVLINLGIHPSSRLRNGLVLWTVHGVTRLHGASVLILGPGESEIEHSLKRNKSFSLWLTRVSWVQSSKSWSWPGQGFVRPRMENEISFVENIMKGSRDRPRDMHELITTGFIHWAILCSILISGRVPNALG